MDRQKVIEICARMNTNERWSCIMWTQLYTITHMNILLENCKMIAGYRKKRNIKMTGLHLIPVEFILYQCERCTLNLFIVISQERKKGCLKV